MSHVLILVVSIVFSMGCLTEKNHGLVASTPQDADSVNQKDLSSSGSDHATDDRSDRKGSPDMSEQPVLRVNLSAKTPPAQVVPKGTQQVLLAVFDFTADNGAAQLSGLTVTFYGMKWSGAEDMKLLVGSTVLAVAKKDERDNYPFTFLPHIIAAGTTEEFRIITDIPVMFDGGQTLAVGIADSDAISTTTPVEGAFPVIGNYFTIADVLACETDADCGVGGGVSCDGSMLVSSGSTGVCGADKLCEQQVTKIMCTYGCVSGACRQPVDCEQPAIGYWQTWCDETVLKYYVPFGMGGCSGPVEVSYQCSAGCQDGTCVNELYNLTCTTDNDCTDLSQEEWECSPDFVNRGRRQRTCQKWSDDQLRCGYTYVSEACPDGCKNGHCINQACDTSSDCEVSGSACWNHQCHEPCSTSTFGEAQVDHSWCLEVGSARYRYRVCSVDLILSEPVQVETQCPLGCMDGACVNNSCLGQADGTVCTIVSEPSWLGECRNQQCCNFGDEFCLPVP